MAQFKDKAGRVWKIDIDINTAIRIKQACGMSIERMFDPKYTSEWDRVTTYLAIKAAVMPDNEESFAKILSDGATAEAAADALGEAAADFLSPTRRSSALSMLSAGKRSEAALLAAMPTVIEKSLAKLQAEINQATQSSGPSTGGQGSPASIPPDSDSAT